jgi:hypothetical protein
MSTLQDGKLMAAFVQSDMGHAGIWGIVLSDVPLEENTSSYFVKREHWIFSDLGTPLYPGVYRAWNDID